MEASHVHSAQAGFDTPHAPRRRITANSFKLLTARLQSKEPLPELFEPPQHLPEEPVTPNLPQFHTSEDFAPAPYHPPEPEPFPEAPPAAELPHEPDGYASPPASFSLPEFVPLNDQYADPNLVAREVPQERPDPIEVPAFAEPLATPEEAQAVDQVAEASTAGEQPSSTPGSWPDIPAFGESLVATPQHIEVEELVEPRAPEVESDLEAAQISSEPQPVPEELPDAAEIQNFEPAPDAPLPTQASEESGAKLQPAAPAVVPDDGSVPRAATPLAEKVVEALIKTVAEAVYAKPSASERAAFLREIAELVEVDGETPVETTAITPEPELPSPPPAQTVSETQEAQPIAPSEEAATITQVIADRLGPSSPILRKTKEQDPFSLPKPPQNQGQSAEILQEADEDTGELALSLLDMMSGGAAASQPQERALAADTLLRLVPRIPIKQLLAISERVAIMEAPPSLLVAKLIRDSRHEVAAPLLERCMHITDQDLATATAEGDVHKLRMIARRRTISPTLSDQLIGRGDTSVILTLVRNPGAALNHDSYFRLAEHAIEHHAVLAPLATRADLPAPVAFELFWHVPHELRRFLLSRFLTDSENLNRILKITMATQAPADGSASAEPKFPQQEQLETAIAHVAKGELETGAQILADAAGIAVETVLRALADRDGEPLAVLLKTLGFQRSRFSDAVASLQNAEISLLNPSRKVEELQSIYDTLSFNKARILLTYWDWYTRKAGPYAPHN